MDYNAQKAQYFKNKYLFDEVIGLEAQQLRSNNNISSQIGGARGQIKIKKEDQIVGLVFSPKKKKRRRSDNKRREKDQLVN